MTFLTCQLIVEKSRITRKQEMTKKQRIAIIGQTGSISAAIAQQNAVPPAVGSFIESPPEPEQSWVRPLFVSGDSVPLDEVIPVREQKTKYLFESGEMVPLGKVESLEIDIPEDLRISMQRLHSRKLEEAMTGTLTGTVSGSTDSGESLDVEQFMSDMRDVIAEIEPLAFMVSSKMLPADSAISFRLGRQEYAGAHPDFWDHPELKEILDEERNSTSFFQFRVIDIDLESNEHHRKAFFDAMVEAFNGQRPAWADQYIGEFK